MIRRTFASAPGAVAVLVALFAHGEVVTARPAAPA